MHHMSWHVVYVYVQPAKFAWCSSTTIVSCAFLHDAWFAPLSNKPAYVFLLLPTRLMQAHSTSWCQKRMWQSSSAACQTHGASTMMDTHTWTLCGTGMQTMRWTWWTSCSATPQARFSVYTQQLWPKCGLGGEVGQPADCVLPLWLVSLLAVLCNHAEAMSHGGRVACCQLY